MRVVVAPEIGGALGETLRRGQAHERAVEDGPARVDTPVDEPKERRVVLARETPPDDVAAALEVHFRVPRHRQHDASEERLLRLGRQMLAQLRQAGLAPRRVHSLERAAYQRPACVRHIPRRCGHQTSLSLREVTTRLREGRREHREGWHTVREACLVGQGYEHVLSSRDENANVSRQTARDDISMHTFRCIHGKRPW
jgi:hypothetical protein